MSSMDNRVVKLTFDNEQFEKKVKDTIKTLQEFEKSLDMKGATAGFDKVSSAADKLNLSGVNKKADETKAKFDEFSESASKSLDKVSDKAQTVDLSGVSSNAKKAASDTENALSSIDLSSVSKSADSADFSGISANAEDAIGDAEHAAANIDLSAISESAEEASSGFSRLEYIAVGALMNIGSKATDLAENALKNLWNSITQPITDGFKEYETQMGSIQTIMANTNMDFDSDEDIQKVNDTLDELNRYADKTIYNFTEMTKNIGTFTAAGLGLEESAEAIQGIANLAALSGASSQDAARGMYQLSQALAAGTVTLMDWRSVENANMGGQVFQKSIADMAVHMASVGKATEEAAVAGHAILDEGVKIRTTLNQKDWGAWFNSDILSETLRLFTYDLREMTATEEEAVRSHLRTLGYQDEEMDTIFNMAEMATRSATEVRTWGQLIETVGESLGSNWAGIWRNLLGDFKQATETFTFLSNTITGAIDGMFSGVINFAKIFNNGGAILTEAYGSMLPDGTEIQSPIDIIFGSFARDENGEKYIDEMTGQFARIKGAVDYLFEAIEAPLVAIKSSFDEIFGMDDLQLAEMLFGLATNFKDFAQSLVISEDAMIGLAGIFDGIFSIVDLGLHFIGDLVTAFFGLVDVARILIDPLIDIALTLGGSVGNGVKTFHDMILLTTNSFKIFVNELMGPVIKSIKEVVQGFFKMADIPGKIRAVTNFIIELINVLWDFIDIPGKFEAALQFFQNLFTDIGKFFGFISDSEDNAAEKSTTFVGVIKSMFEGITNAITTAFPFVKDIGNAFSDFFKIMDSGDPEATRNYVVGMLKGISDNVSKVTGPLMELGQAIGGFFGRMVEGVSKLDIVQNVIQGFKSFVDWVSNLISSIFNVREAFAIGTDDMAEKSDVFTIIGEKISQLTEFVNSLTFENITKSLTEFKDKVVNDFMNVFEYLSTHSPLEIFNDFLDGVKDKAKGAITSLRQMVPAFDKLLKDLDDKNIRDNSPVLKFLSTMRDIITGIIKVLSGFANGLINVTTGIVEAIRQNEKFNAVIGKVKEVFSGFVMMIQSSDFGSKIVEQFKLMASGEGIKDNFDKIAEFFNTLTVDKIVDAAGKLKDDVVEKFGAIGTAISPVIDTIVKGVTDFFTNATKDANSFSDVIQNIRTTIEKAFFDLPTTLGNIFSSIFSPREANAETTSMPKIDLADSITFDEKKIPNIFEEIVKAITNAFNNIKGSLGEAHKVIDNVLNGTILDDFVKFVKDGGKSASEIKDGIIDRVMSTFSGFADGMRNNKDIIDMVLNGGLIISIRQFLKSLKGTTKSLGGMFDSFANVGKSISNLPKTMADGMTKFAKSLNKWREETPAEAILKIAAAIAVLAASLWVIASIPADDLIRAGQAMAIMAGALVAVILAISLMDKFKLTNKDTLTAIGKSFEGIGIGMVALAAGLLLMTQLTQNNQLDKALQVVTGLMLEFAILAAIMKSNKVGTQILAAAAGLLVLSFALRSLIKTIEMWNAFDWVGNLKGLAGMAITIAALGLALRVAGPNALKAAAGMLILSVAMLALVPAIAAMALIEKLMGGGDFVVMMVGLGIAMVAMGGALRLAGEHAIKAGAGFLLLAASITVMTVALGALSLVANINNAEGLKAAVIAIGALVGGFTLISAIMDTKKLTATAKALVTFSAAILVMSASLAVLTLVPWEKLYAGAGALGVLILAFGGITALTDKSDISKTAKSMLIFSAALAVMAATLAALTYFPWENLLAGAGALGVLVLALGAMTALTKESDILATSAGLVVFSLAIAAMAASLAALTYFPWEKLYAGAGALGVLILVLGALTALTKETDIAVTAASFILFAGGIMIMSGALQMLANVPIDNLMPAAIALGVLSAVVLGLSAVLVGFGEVSIVVLPLVALVLVAFGGTALMIAYAVEILAGGLEHLATTGPALATFAQTIGSNLPNFAMTALAFVALGAGLAVLGAGVAVFGVAALGASVGIAALTLALGAFLLVAQGLQAFVDAGFNITAGIGEGIGGGLGVVTQAIMGIGQGILNAILSFFGIASPSALMADQVGQYIPEGIGLGIENNEGGLMDTIGNTLGGLLEKFWTWVQEEGLPKLQEFGENILHEAEGLTPKIENWVNTTAIPALEGFARNILDRIMEELGKLPQKLIDWASGIPGAIWEGIQSDRRTIASIGEDIINGVISGIQSAPETIANALLGAAQDGLASVKQFFGIASPSKVMRDQVGKFLPMGIGEGIRKYVGYAVDQAVAMGKSVMDGVDSNLHPASTSINIDFDAKIPMSPTISPVIDMSAIDSNLDWLETQMAAFNFDASMTNLQNIDANVDFSSLNQLSSEQSMRIAELTDQNEKLLSEVAQLRTEMEEYTDAINNSAIVMDSGLLVGAIAPQMDNALGRRQELARRGVIR